MNKLYYYVAVKKDTANKSHSIICLNYAQISCATESRTTFPFFPLSLALFLTF